MCGRYTQKQAVRKYMEPIAPSWAKELSEDRPPTFNLSPTAASWVIRDIESELTPNVFKWGLSGEPGSKFAPFNARVETIAEKFPFKFAWKDRRRCLVPSDGWYEWREENGAKQPYYFTRTDGQPIYFAGLWTSNTFTLITTEADGHLAEIHHRKPISLSTDLVGTWLEQGIDTADGLIASSTKSEVFKVHAVSKLVSNSRNNGPDLINPL